MKATVTTSFLTALMTVLPFTALAASIPHSKRFDYVEPYFWNVGYGMACWYCGPIITAETGCHCEACGEVACKVATPTCSNPPCYVPPITKGDQDAYCQLWGDRKQVEGCKYTPTHPTIVPTGYPSTPSYNPSLAPSILPSAGGGIGG